jgi:uncharacterized protein YecT (DUF1311 family)
VIKRATLPLVCTIAWLTQAVASAADLPERNCADLDKQADMSACSLTQSQAADAELNRIYQDLVKKKTGDAKALAMLREAERAWVAYRDKECAFEAAGVEGGSMQPFIVSTASRR